ncbi:MAG: hypothetical protein V4710_12470 [Verrucomicrobiota bacterium]
MSESNILPINAGTLQFQWRRGQHDISFDSDYLTYTYGFFSGFKTTEKTPLWRLLDVFVVDIPPAPRAAYYGSRVRYALCFALVVHFSEIPRFVPYLAPALFLYAFYAFYNVVRVVAWPMRQTRILDNFGAQIVAIPHLPKLDDHRQRWEASLIEAIRDAKAAHDQ